MGCYLSPLGNLPYISDHSIIVWAGILIAQLFNRSGARESEMKKLQRDSKNYCNFSIVFFKQYSLISHSQYLPIKWVNFFSNKTQLLSARDNCKVIFSQFLYVVTRILMEFITFNNLIFFFLFADIPWCVDHCLFLPDGHRNRCHFAQC